jgi:hypothetical protein
MYNESDATREQSPKSGADDVQQRTVVIPFPENFIYVNCAAFSVTANEIRLGFAEAMQDGRAVSKVGVVMPPETAAVIAMVLFRQVQIFEQNFGEIRHPMWKAMKAGHDTSPFADFVPHAAPKVTENPTE